MIIKTISGVLIFSTLILAASCSLKQSARTAGESISAPGAYSWSSSSSLARPENSTQIVILIDGLNQEVFQQMMAQDLLPNMQEFFHSRSYTARSVFPSLTYPNITSLLTERPLALHPIYGNQIRSGATHVNFENPFEVSKLEELIGAISFFGQLKAANEPSWSFAYSFNFGTRKFLRPNLTAGLQYAGSDYKGLDRDILQQATRAIAETRRWRTAKALRDWPRLVFVHLVGVDAISHSRGPYDVEVVEYLKGLDQHLVPLFSAIKAREAVRSITTVLASDHGFEKVQTTLPIESLIEAAAKKVSPSRRKAQPLIANEMRIAALHFSALWNVADRQDLAKRMSSIAGIAAVLLRVNENLFQVETSEGIRELSVIAGESCPPYRFRLEVKRDRGLGPVTIRDCPQNLDGGEIKSGSSPISRDLYHLYENVAGYFAQPESGDMVIVAGPGVGFNDKYLGQHGGMSQREIQTPLLLRNAVVTSHEDDVPIYEILKTNSSGL